MSARAGGRKSAPAPGVLERASLDLLAEALAELDAGMRHLPPLEHQLDRNAVREVLLETARRMQDNFPYPHPLYAGQMMKPPHPVARLAYALAMWINPNNHALDGGRASSAMEKEAVANIAAMFGWDEHLGHLTSGGTMANLEALWVSGQLRPGERVLASSQAHYTHARISQVLGLDFQSVPVDENARMDLRALYAMLRDGDIGTVVATLGTTGTGAVDPLEQILALRDEYGFRLHVDAAYGGYFTLAGNLASPARVAFDRLGEVDSIVIDPHKHGLQPYGCGCVLFQDPAVGNIYKHDSAYTYFTSDELHLGEISLECSRAGAAAVALWATQRLLPAVAGSEFARGLEQGRDAALALHGWLARHPRFLTLGEPELDIVVWAPKAPTASRVSEATRYCFDTAARLDLHFALMKVPAAIASRHWRDVSFDAEYVTCLRACLMKPEHRDWIERIGAILDRIVPGD